MKILKIIPTLCFGLLLIASCGKDEESSGNKEPIAVIVPSTNPATTIKGSPINYKIDFTVAELIDSVQVFHQIDSFSTGYDASKDSLIRKDVWIGSSRTNLRSIEGSYIPRVFPPVGKYVYMTIWLHAQTKFYTKKVTFEVR